MHFSYFLVIFREVMEIVLLVGIFNARMHEVPNLKRLNIISILLATIAAITVAAIISHISTLGIENNLQDYLDIAVLSVGFIGIVYTVFGANNKPKIGTYSQINNITIVLILFSMLFREMMEIVIFSYSMLSASKSNIHEYILSFVAGTIGAITIGILVKNQFISSKKYLGHMFKITNIMMLIIAGSFLIKIIKTALSLITSDKILSSSIYEQFVETAFNDLIVIDSLKINMSTLDILIYITMLAPYFMLLSKRTIAK